MNKLRDEIEHEQRVTIEVESWLRDRNKYLTTLRKGNSEKDDCKEEEIMKRGDRNWLSYTWSMLLVFVTWLMFRMARKTKR